MKRSEVLNTAKKCVCEERDHQYGSPEDNFARIASLWSNFKGETFTPKDVSVMMILVKVARLAGGDCIDNYVDIAGYAACGGELAEKTAADEARKKADFDTSSHAVLFTKVDADLGSLLVDKGEDGPRMRSYFQEKEDVWVAIDNSTGDCWVEDFVCEDDCILWLSEKREADEEYESDDDYDWEEDYE